MKKKGFFQRSLDRVELVGNKLPHPVTLFALLALLVLILSAIISTFNIEVEHPGIEGEIVSVTNLLTNEGIAHIFTSMTELHWIRSFRCCACYNARNWAS